MSLRRSIPHDRWRGDTVRETRTIRNHTTRGVACARRGTVTFGYDVLDGDWYRVRGAKSVQLTCATITYLVHHRASYALLRHASEKIAVQRTARDGPGVWTSIAREKKQVAIVCESRTGTEVRPRKVHETTSGMKCGG